MGYKTDEALRKELIESEYGCYTDCAHFTGVVYKGDWSTVTFLKRKDDASVPFGHPEYLVIMSSRMNLCATDGDNNLTDRFTFRHLVKNSVALSREEGNDLFTALRDSRKVSGKGYVYYDLKKALGSLPVSSTLDSRMVRHVK